MTSAGGASITFVMTSILFMISPKIVNNVNAETELRQSLQENMWTHLARPPFIRSDFDVSGKTLPHLARLKGGGRRPVLTESEIVEFIMRELNETSGSFERKQHNVPHRSHPAADAMSCPVPTSDNGTAPGPLSELFLADARAAMRQCRAQNRSLLVWVPADAGDAGDISSAMMRSVWSRPEVCPHSLAPPRPPTQQTVSSPAAGRRAARRAPRRKR